MLPCGKFKHLLPSCGPEVVSDGLPTVSVMSITLPMVPSFFPMLFESSNLYRSRRLVGPTAAARTTVELDDQVPLYTAFGGKLSHGCPISAACADACTLANDVPTHCFSDKSPSRHGIGFCWVPPG